MSPETAEGVHEEPKAKSGEDEAAKNKAPEQRENDEKLATRRAYREIQQKVKDAIEMATAQKLTPAATQQLINDFVNSQLGNLSGTEREAVSKLHPTLIFPTQIVDEFATQKWGQGKNIYKTVIYQVNVASSLACNVSLMYDPVLQKYDDYYDSAKSSDAEKAPKESPGTMDRPPQQLMAALNQKVLDAKAQFNKSTGEKSESTYMRTINDYVSDAYSRFTTSEKASLAGQIIRSEVDINRSDAETATGMITAGFKARIRFFGNNYIVSY